MNRKQTVLLAVALITIIVRGAIAQVTANAASLDQFVDRHAASNQWIYEDAGRFNDAHVLFWPGLTYGGTWSRAGTRFHVVELTRREFVDNIVRIIADAEKEPVECKRLRDNPELFKVLLQFIDHFEADLKATSNDPSALKSRVRLLSGISSQTMVEPVHPPFQDVPQNHWAFASVEALREAGIVVGYPEGTFAVATQPAP